MTRRLLVSALAVSLIQVGFLVWMVASRAALLRNGAEIVLAVASVRRADGLVGTAVELDPALSPLPTGLVADLPPGRDLPDGKLIVLRLGKAEDGLWTPVAAFLERPGSAPAAGETDMTAKLVGTAAANAPFLPLRFGWTRLGLPDEAGEALFAAPPGGRLAVKLAVGSDGAAQVRSLLRDGRPVFEEPVW